MKVKQFLRGVPCCLRTALRRHGASCLLTACGFVLLGLGGIGIFIPVWPTTPLVLAASACFSGNPRLRAWLLKIQFFNEHLTNYRQRTGLKKSTVAWSLCFLWGMLLLSMFTMGEIGRAVLLSAVGVAVTVHILCIARPKKKGT